MLLSALIPATPLLAAGSFGPELVAGRVADAITRGLQAGGVPAPELCPIDLAHEPAGEVRALLDAFQFDSRMRSARAVILAARSLHERMLEVSAAFEIATRARQAGVPAYAVTGENRLDPFDARMLDLQAIIEARSTRALAAAGRELARLL
jgi:glycerate 2-kinase